MANWFTEHLAQTTPFPFGIKVSHAKGSYIYDTDGKAYLDLISGIAVSHLGHGHPRILKAIQNQAQKHLHVMVYGEFEQAAQNELAKELSATLPPSLNSFYFVNSGTEANEAAMKLVKRVTGRTEIIAFEGSYHGSTQGALSISHKELKKSPFRPLLPNIRFIRLNNYDDLKYISHQTAGVFLETIQGDAGVRIPDQNYLEALRTKCDETCALLVFDEIQCGMGRTGKMWAFEHFGVTPDILTAGKALGGGLPIGALISSKGLMRKFSDNPMLGHITTFGGHPLICATAAEGLKIIKDEKLLDNCSRMAKLISQEIQHKKIKAVRQKGLMIAIELENEAVVQKVVIEALEKGIVLFWFLSTPNAFRMAPPLNITEKDIRQGIAIIHDILAKV